MIYLQYMCALNDVCACAPTSACACAVYVTCHTKEI